MSSERNIASGRLKKATQGLEQSTFATTGSPGNRDTVTFVDLEVNTVQNLDR
jgi:hypothetical protein